MAGSFLGPLLYVIIYYICVYSHVSVHFFLSEHLAPLPLGKKQATHGTWDLLLKSMASESADQGLGCGQAS